MQPLDPQLVPPDSIRWLRRREYDQLVQLGVFEGEKVELLFGRMVEMSPIGRAHAYAVWRLTQALTVALAGRARVQAQSPVAASDDSEPEPDVAVLELADFLDDHATSAHLIVEVADSSLDKDLQLKARLYADMGVPDYWVVDLLHRVVVVHRGPGDGRYADVTTVGSSGTVAPLRFVEVILRVDEILPPARP